MECRAAEEYLSYLVDGELEAHQKASIEGHLQICGGCSRKLRQFQLLREALKDVPPVAVPGRFLQDLRVRLDQPEGLVDRWEPVLMFLTGRRLAAAGSLAALLGIAWIGGFPMLGPDSIHRTRPVEGAPAAPASVPAPAVVAGSAGPGGVRAKDDADEAAPAAPAASNGLVVPGTPATLEKAPDPQVNRSLALAPAPAADKAAPPPPAEEAKRERAAAPAPEPRVARRGAAEAFDADYGVAAKPTLKMPEGERRAVAEAPKPASGAPAPGGAGFGGSPFGALAAAGPVPAAAPPLPVAAAAKAARPMVAAAPAASRPRLEEMNEDQLDGELDRMMDDRTARDARTLGSLDIFDPGAGGDLLGRMSEAQAAGMEAGGGAPARKERALASPEFVPVTLGWVRTRFGRKVEVLEATTPARFQGVARDLEVRARDSRQLLTSLTDLVQSSPGLELERVLVRPGEEIQLLVQCGKGSSGVAAISRFVDDIRGVSGADISSDASAALPDGTALSIRVVVPQAVAR